MRKDIYVVQKTAEEGKQLEDWCIENYIPISSSRFGFDESWKLFIWYQTLQDGFIANQSIKINKQDLTQVTIEEFKRLQLESLGKTEELKIGDWVLIKLDQFDSLGEGGKFNDKKGVPLRIEEISNRCICKLSGIHCILSFDRFEKCEKPSSDLKSEFIVGKWYKILDNWWAKFKTVHNSGNRWQFSEHIDKNGAYSNIIQSIDVISEIKLLTDLSEIQEYLPLNHSDLIVKNICPEYVEYIDTKYKGQIVRVTKWSANSYCEVIFLDGTKEQPFKHLVKAVTKEQWEQQNKVSDPKKYDYEVVHCKTQEEGITMENTYYIKVNNQEQLDELIQDFKQQGYENSNREITFKSTFFIVYPVLKQFQLLSDNCGYPEKQWEFKKSNESLVGRWVKRISYNVYSSFKNPKIGEYDLIESDNGRNWCLKTFMNCEKEYLLKDFELMPEGFNPNEVVKPSLDFNQLNIEDWLRETKKLNLSQEQLQYHIDYRDTCKQIVYRQLKGNTLEEKTGILWNEWNKPGIDKKDFIVSIPDEWGQNKYVIGIDPYNLIEEFKPNTQATLIPVKQKQIFKN